MIARVRSARPWQWLGAVALTTLQARLAGRSAGGRRANRPMRAPGWRACNKRRPRCNYQGTLVVQRRRRGVEFARGALLRRQAPYERIECSMARRARCSATTTSCTRCGRARAWRWSSSATAMPGSGACCGRRQRALRGLRPARAGHRPCGRPRGPGAAAQAADAHRFAQRLWAEQVERAAAACRRAGCARRGARVGRVLRRGDRRQGAAPRACCRRCASSTATASCARAAVRTKLDAEGWALARPVPGFQLVGCMRKRTRARSASRCRRQSAGAAGGLLRRPDPRVGVRRTVRCRSATSRWPPASAQPTR